MGSFVKTTLLLGFLTGLLVIVGRAIGGPGGMIFAFLIAIAMNFGAYWYSDRVVLRMYRAREVSREEAPGLHAIVEALVSRTEIPRPRVYIVPTSTPNAFATGRNPEHAAVAVTEGILNLLNREELEGVLAHELAHVKNRDTLISTIAATIAGAISMVATWARFAAIFGGMGRRERQGGILGFIFLAILAPIAAMIIQFAISRTREFGADRTGAEISGKPRALASALRKLESGVSSAPMEKGDPSTAHLFIVNPFKKVSLGNLFSTHPRTEERIERLMGLR